MKYALLIYGNEKERERTPPEAIRAMYQAFDSFSRAG